MKLRHTILIHAAAMMLGIGSFGAYAAAPAAAFPSSSVLAKGRWIKIHVDKTGIYEITQEELAEMGFTNPYILGLYGRSASLQPTQFVNTKGEAYSSDLTPVPIKVRNGKIYFYAQAVPDVRYFYENHNKSNPMRFDQQSNQVFSNEVVFFLTDTPPKKVSITAADLGTFNSSLPPLQEAWAYDYHEVDNFTYMHGGRDFYGESFAETANRRQTFEYEIPNAVEGSTACITTVFAARAVNQSELKYGFVTEEGDVTGSSTIAALSKGDNYNFNNITHLNLPIGKSKGEVVFDYNPNGDVTFAALDYFVVGAQRKLQFGENETQFTVYPYEFTRSKYSWLELPFTNSNLSIWQITSPSQMVELPYRAQYDTGVTRILGMTNNHPGPLVIFDHSKEQNRIKSYEEIPNQNLHALGTDKMPAMVIITLPALKEAADKLAQIHKQYDGIDVAVVLHEDVVNEFSSGVDDPMAYRALAKMLYDRDDPQNRVFKNMLLFGPNVRDHRNVLGIVPEIGTLISNQAYNTRYTDYSFCMNDWYGMLDDTTYEQTTSYYFSQVPMQIGIGVLPVNDEASAMAAVEKIARFYADDSYAYWLGNFNYIADGNDDNEHQNWEEALHEDMSTFTSKAGFGTKIYNNLNVDYGTRDLLVKKLSDGSMISYYTGHATSEQLGSFFLDMGAERKFTNNRLGFMMIGACDVAPFDNNTVGIGAKMVNLPSTGFVAALVTSRDCYSRHNYNLLDAMQKYMLLDDATDPSSLLSAPRTIGEVYSLAKTKITNHPNKFAYHIYGDPAITLPIPTANVSVEVVDVAAEGVYPGSQIKIQGEVKDRSGKLCEDFNGQVVVKLCLPAYETTTSNRQGSRPVQVMLDQSVIGVYAFDVADGKYAGELLIPTDTPQTSEELLSLRASAYDPTSRLSAIGVQQVSVQDYVAEQAVESDMAPMVENIYVNAPGVTEDTWVANPFVLHADVSDDYGMMAYDVNGMTSMYLTIDGRMFKNDLQSYLTLSNGGKNGHLAYPISGLEEGNHLLRLTVCDANGQQNSATLNVRVGSPFDAAELSLESAGPVRNKALLVLDNPNSGSSNRLKIVDACGKRVHTAEMSNGQYEWNLKNDDGSRVKPGIYYAVCSQTINGKGTAVTEPCEIIVF